MIGFDSCGMVFGAIQSCFRQRCRFYPDDNRVTYIRWQFAPPGAAYYMGPSPFHPFYFADKFMPAKASECGALEYKRTWQRDSVRLGTDGQQADGTTADFEGRGSVSEVQTAGVFDPDKVPRCALPTAWAARDGSPDVAAWTCGSGNMALSERAAWTASAYDRSPGLPGELPVWTCHDASTRPARLLANPQHPPIDGWAQQEM